MDYFLAYKAMITGSIVAIVTPMHEDGSLDLNSLRNLVDFHVREGTDGIVIVGTTGESPTVNVEEHCELIRATVEHAAGRIPVIAGTGANSTAEAIELTEFARKAGADMALSVVPYSTRPRKASIAISRRLPKRSNSPFCFITCRAAPSPTCRTTPSCVWPGCRVSSASRTRPATSTAPAT
jgi:dihydrodipicolinate synthase/N-acetylneuraminate lyase